MTNKNKGIYEEFASFFEQPSRESFRNLVKRNFGERNQIDFKQEWPEQAKLAKHILAMANSGGGVLVIGIAEKSDGTLDSVGIIAMSDKTVVGKSIQKFIPHQLKYDILNLSFSSSEYKDIQGKMFQVVVVEYAPEYIPFVSQAESSGIRKSAIYVRRSTNSEEATYEELQDILNKRVATNYSSDKEINIGQEMAELKGLYSMTNRHRERISMAHLWLNAGVTEKNPHYPSEDFDQFVARMIELKKKRIERMIRTNKKSFK